VCAKCSLCIINLRLTLTSSHFGLGLRSQVQLVNITGHWTEKNGKCGLANVLVTGITKMQVSEAC